MTHPFWITLQWSNDNNLYLNSSKTKEMIVDFRRMQKVSHAPLHINGSAVEKVKSINWNILMCTSLMTCPGLCIPHQYSNLLASVLFPTEAQELWPPSQNLHHLLQMHDWEHFDGVLGCLVWQLLPPRPKGPSESRENIWTHHRLNFQPYRTYFICDVWGRLAKSQLTPVTTMSSPNCYQSGNTGAFSPEPAGWRSVSSCRSLEPQTTEMQALL